MLSGTWGNSIKLSIFGESHGEGIGIVIDGIKPGIKLDLDYIYYEMKRRAPGESTLTTARRERDDFKILSGYFNGRTTGTPLAVVIFNHSQNSKDYEKTKNLMRPSHGDFPGYIKYGGFNDYRGGGHFSGRLTAPLVFAGAICKKILEDQQIFLGSHIKSIGKIEDDSFDFTNINKETLNMLKKSRIPLLNEGINETVEHAIEEAKKNKDSLGGIVEGAAINVPVGIGEPFFNSLESQLASLLFSIPGVKGVEFGLGFDITRLKGSEAKDEYYMKGNNVKTYTNNNGGILGGISNGMPIIFRVAIKPTPSIGKIQKTINVDKMENHSIEIIGRHDPSIVLRAIPVVEAVTAIALLDLIQM